MVATVDWGDGQTETITLALSYPNNDGFYTYRSPSIGLSHTYAKPDLYHATLTVSDGDAAVSASSDVSVGTYAPILYGVALNRPDGTYADETFEAEARVAQGKVQFGRPDRGAAVTVDWADGSPTETRYIAPGEIVNGVGAFSFLHRYADDLIVDGTPEAYKAIFTVVDDAGFENLYGPQQSNFFVINSAPTAAVSLSADSVEAGQALTLSAVVSDPGLLDAQSVLIDWGDGTSETVELPADGTTEKAFSRDHAYAQASPADAPYVVTVTATDGGDTVTTSTPTPPRRPRKSPSCCRPRRRRATRSPSPSTAPPARWP